jgi:hypothetical protein
MTFASGDIYQGVWMTGLQHGKGKMTYTNGGAVYKGEWQNGMKHGQAKAGTDVGNVLETTSNRFFV